MSDLGAVVAGAHRDGVAVEDLRDVVSVHTLHLEGDDADAVVARRRAEDPEPGDVGEALQRVGAQLRLVGVGRVEADAFEPLDGRGEADRLGDRRRPGLELGPGRRPR